MSIRSDAVESIDLQYSAILIVRVRLICDVILACDPEVQLEDWSLILDLEAFFEEFWRSEVVRSPLTLSSG